MISVTFERTALSLGDLTISTYPEAGVAWWLPENGLEEPSWAFRTTYAPESAYIPGSKALAAVLDASSLPLSIYVRAIPGLSLGAAKAVIEAAASQWAYDVTVNISGSERTYQADPCWPQWDVVDSGMTAAGMARCSLNIPVNPPSE